MPGLGATGTSILDPRNYYRGESVEDALAELGAERRGRIGNGIAAVGDSITSLYGNGLFTRMPDGYLSIACMDAKQIVVCRGARGAAGFTLQQIYDQIFPEILGLTPQPLACVIHAGTNDCGANAGVGYTVTNSIANISLMARQLMERGIVPILTTVLPRGDSATVNQNVGKLNRAIFKLSQDNGYDLVDLHRAVCNVNTGVFITGYCQTDNIHPSFKGLRKMGTALNAALARMQIPFNGPPRPTSRLDPTNLLTTFGHFQVDTNADGIGDGFTSFSTMTGMTFSIVTDADTITKWQKISVPNTATGAQALLQCSVSGAGVPGDIIEISGRVQTTGFEAALVDPVGLNGGTGPAWQATVAVTGGTTDLEPAYLHHNDQSDGIFYLRGAIPGVGATGQLKFNLAITGQPASGTVTAQFTDLCMRNLTALGLI